MRAFYVYAGGVITPFLFEAQYCSNWRAWYVRAMTRCVQAAIVHARARRN
jgi:hypothetical protein